MERQNVNRFSREVVCKDNVLNLNLDIPWQLTISLLEILNLVSKVQRLPLAGSSQLVFLAHSHKLFSHQAIPITGQCGITDGNFAAGLQGEWMTLAISGATILPQISYSIPAAILGGRWVHSTPTQRVERVLGNLVSIDFFSPAPLSDWNFCNWWHPRSWKVSVGNSTVREFDYDSVRAPSTPIRKAVVRFWAFVHCRALHQSLPVSLGAFHVRFLGWKSEGTCQWFWKNHPILVSSNLLFQNLLAALPLWDWCRSLLLNATKFATACGDAQGYLQRHFGYLGPPDG